MEQIDKAHRTESRLYKKYIKRFFDIIFAISWAGFLQIGENRKRLFYVFDV